jgi:hypothetical protein
MLLQLPVLLRLPHVRQKCCLIFLITPNYTFCNSTQPQYETQLWVTNYLGSKHAWLDEVTIYSLIMASRDNVRVDYNYFRLLS